MAQLHASRLQLRLPDPRFSVNFADYDVENTKTCATSKKYMHDLFPGQNKPLPTPKNDPPCRRIIPPTPSSHELRWQNQSRKANSSRLHHEKHGKQDMDANSRPLPDSNADKLVAPPSSAVAYFVLSNASTHKSTFTLKSLIPPMSSTLNFEKPQHSLLDLPQPIQRQVLSYVLSDQQAIIITPYQSHVPPKRRRRRTGPTETDIRSVMMHPVLFISQKIRELALEVLYHDSLFVIDLCETNGITPTANDEATSKYWHCWTQSPPPSMVKTALFRALNIRIRIPVPGTATTVVPNVARRKTPPKDVLYTAHDSLRAVTALITGIPRSSPPTDQHRSTSPPRPRALRRKLSFRSAKHRESLEFVCRGEPNPPTASRQPLSRLEIMFIKSSPMTPVHGQTLDVVGVCSSIPVSGFLEYFLELEGRRKLWAKRAMGTWLGSEPDGSKLFHDLRALGVPKSTLEVSNHGNLLPSHRRGESTGPSQKYLPGKPLLDWQPRKRSASDTRLQKDARFAINVRQINALSKTRVMKYSKEPPTIEELQQIAADFKRAMY